MNITLIVISLEEIFTLNIFSSRKLASYLPMQGLLGFFLIHVPSEADHIYENKKM